MESNYAVTYTDDKGRCTGAGSGLTRGRAHRLATELQGKGARDVAVRSAAAAAAISNA